MIIAMVMITIMMMTVHIARRERPAFTAVLGANIATVAKAAHMPGKPVTMTVVFMAVIAIVPIPATHALMVALARPVMATGITIRVIEHVVDH
ncbi:MAG: hypothetical protein R3F42_02845 [Pseudomonadota bacterium]